MIRHIFCDLDGTLYHNGISKDDISSIKHIEKKGVKFHIATGRTFIDTNSMIKDCINIDGYYICENGAFIYDKNHKSIKRCASGHTYCRVCLWMWKNYRSFSRKRNVGKRKLKPDCFY